MLAIIGVAVAVVAGIALTDQKDTSTSAASAPSRTITRTASAPSTPAPSSKATTPSGTDSGSTATSGPKRFPLVVLNNSTVTGLAKLAAKQFRQGGWTVSSTDNLTNDILSTCAYYDPTQKGAKKAAENLQEQFPGIQRVEEKFAELPPGPVVVVLTGSYPAG